MLRRSAGTSSFIVRISRGNKTHGCFRSLSSSSVVANRQCINRRLSSSCDNNLSSFVRHRCSTTTNNNGALTTMTQFHKMMGGDDICGGGGGLGGPRHHYRFINTSSFLRSPLLNNRNVSCYEIDNCHRGMIVPSSALFGPMRMGGSKLWMSSSSGSNNGNKSTETNGSNTTPTSSSSPPPESPPGDKSPPSFKNNSSTPTHSSSSPPPSSSSSGKVDDTLRDVSQRWTKIKQVWAVSDFVAVWSTLFLFFCILVAPNVIKNMRDDSPHPYDDIVDDEITTLTRQLLQTATDPSISEKNPLVESLSDLLSRISATPTLRQSLSELTAAVLTSPEVTVASQILIKKLFHDLINDEETLRQVVTLLQLVLRDESVKQSVIRLIASLTQDEDVVRSLAHLLSRLSREEGVQKATQELLTQSTHKTLSDWEVLEHGMEFAADVVGDDVVQRTGGEALWNTISYSVRPGFATLLSFVGISFLGVSLYLFRRPTSSSPLPSSPSSDHLAMAMASIGRDVHGNALYGVSSLWAIPFRTAEGIVVAIGTVVGLPKRVVMMCVNGGRRVVEEMRERVEGVRRGVWYIVVGDPSTRSTDGGTMTLITHRLSTLTQSFNHYLMNTITWNITILNHHVITCFQSIQKRIDNQLNQIARRTIDNFNSSKMGRLLQSCRETLEQWKATIIQWGEEWREVVRSWLETIQRYGRDGLKCGQRLCSAGIRRWNDIWGLWHGMLDYLRHIAMQSQRLGELLQWIIIERSEAVRRLGWEGVEASERLYWDMVRALKKDWVRLMTRSREGMEEVKRLGEEWKVLMVLWWRIFFEKGEDMI